MSVDPAVAAYRIGAAVSQRTPPGVIAPLRRGGSFLAARAMGDRRFMIGRHLQRVNGGPIPKRRLDRMIDQAFDAYAEYWVTSARLPELSDAEIDNGFSYDGFGHIEDGWARGVGPILALPHLGSWEWAGRWLTCRPGYEVTVVVEPQNPPELFELMVDYRRKFGMNVVPLGPDVAGIVTKALKDNHVVCLLCDRDIAGGGIEVDFFGETTTLPGGPATLALRTGAAIVPVAVYQAGDRHHAVCRPPVPAERLGRLRSDVGRVTQLLARELEVLVRGAPTQWHLMQPNWPSDHEALAERGAR